ncbi:MAG: SGNH/GDSL hydrolase family protein [Endozoicomonadaceae bacterium]|nr:SGNH/GDSL hydrolase family protein [Endozoicomonadaceae bacterium]
MVSKRWHQKYWNPINKQGYRDYEHSWKEPVLFVLGDSFIAGHGIDKIDDRLASQLSKKLGEKWTVSILAKNGWSTLDEYNALINHHQKPQKIIVSYYLNDIASAARKHGYKMVVLKTNPPVIIKPLVDNSYLFNWYYWKLNAPISGKRHFEKAYRNDKIWATHTKELQGIIDYASNIDAHISFIVWPRLTDIEASLEFTTKVTDFLKKQQVEVINLSEVFVGRSPKNLVVNKWDGHPNVAVNAEVANLLYESLIPF